MLLDIEVFGIRQNPVSAHRSFKIYFLHGIVFSSLFVLGQVKHIQTFVCLGLGKIYSDEIKAD